LVEWLPQVKYVSRACATAQILAHRRADELPLHNANADRRFNA
jgi:hypothetical protein